MKIIQTTAGWHSCDRELRKLQLRSNLVDEPGAIVECSCGLRYQLTSPAGMLKWVFGVGSGNAEGRYFPHTYWRGLGRSNPE